MKMSMADDLHTAASKEIEDHVESLRKLWAIQSHTDPAVWRSQILRWRETNWTIIGATLGETEQQRFRLESKALKVSGEGDEEALT